MIWGVPLFSETPISPCFGPPLRSVFWPQTHANQSHCCIHRLRILIGLKRKRQVIQAAVTELYPQTLELTNNLCWLVVSTPLKNISQNVNLPQIGMKIKHIWNHHPVWNGHVNSPSQNGHKLAALPGDWSWWCPKIIPLGSCLSIVRNEGKHLAC